MASNVVFWSESRAGLSVMRSARWMASCQVVDDDVDDDDDEDYDDDDDYDDDEEDQDAEDDSDHVVEGGEDGLDEGELRVESQEVEHEEEHDGPELGERQLAERLGEGDEGEAGPAGDDVLDWHSLLVGQVTWAGRAGGGEGREGQGQGREIGMGIGGDEEGRDMD